MHDTLTADHAADLARIALGHVTREYPNKPEHTLAGPEDARTPSTLHPVFYGSFDWHSCVHSYWLLARTLRRCPGGGEAAAIERLFDQQLTPDNIAGECAYLAAPTARGFKRPYGWGWLLKLAAELDGTRWSQAIRPLAGIFADRFRAFLPIASLPVRVGTHGNTAFGLRMAADWAETDGDAGLSAMLLQSAERWYGGDVDCPAWGEPGGDDFLSSALIEAECMRRLLSASAFRPWFDGFLPRLLDREPATLFSPAVPTDRTDGKIAHLDGLNLSRAWCFRSLAAAMPAHDPRRPVLQAAAAAHLQASLPHLEGDYMGEHWLATYALLAVDEVSADGPGAARG